MHIPQPTIFCPNTPHPLPSTEHGSTSLPDRGTPSIVPVKVERGGQVAKFVPAQRSRYTSASETCPPNASISYQDAQGTHEAHIDPPIPTTDAPGAQLVLCAMKREKSALLFGRTMGIETCQTGRQPRPPVSEYHQQPAGAAGALRDPQRTATRRKRKESKCQLFGQNGTGGPPSGRACWMELLYFSR